MKVYWLFNHPAPYKVDLFNILGKSVDLTVVFERDSEGGRNATFYNEKATNFKVHICKSIKLGALNSFTREPLKILKSEHFDIVVINGWRMYAERLLIRYCRKHNIPYVFAINGGIVREKENFLLKHLKNKYMSRASSYLAPDKRSANYLIHYGADESKIHLFPYSTVFEEQVLLAPYTKEQKSAVKTQFRMVGEKTFISSGQLIERKNFGELIDIWASLPSGYHLYIAGEGPLKEKLSKQIETLGLTNVHLMGYLSHDSLLKCFRGADAFVFLSKEDIYGHVINEALSQGIPVITPECVNAGSKLIQNGKNGYLVKLGDKKGILKAIQKVANQDDLGEGALATARENTIEKTAEFHLRFFEDYLKQ